MSEEILFFFFSGGIINGTILSLLLFFSPAAGNSKPLSNRLLGSLLFLFSLELFCVSFFDKSITADISSVGQLILLAVVNFVFLYGVLFYLYVKSVVFKLPKLPRSSIWHLLPFFLFIVVALAGFLVRGGVGGSKVFLGVFGVFYLLQGILGGVYLFLSLKLLAAYKTHTRGNYSNLARINLNWLTNITFLQLFLWVTSVTGTLIQILSPSSLGAADIVLEIFYLGMTAVILFAGYTAYRYPEAFHRHIPLEPAEPQEKTGTQDRDLRQNLEKAQYNHLMEVMEQEKPYTDPDLTLKELSDHVKIPVYLLSRLINRYSGSNFFNFINGFRVEEVKKRLGDERFKELGLLNIALDCGFSSKTTFNTIFKKTTGMTPSQYRSRAA